MMSKLNKWFQKETILTSLLKFMYITYSQADKEDTPYTQALLPKIPQF